jgi:hypothetical protein
VLFGNGRFLCGRCCAIGYRSQRESRWSRTMRRMHKLRAWLGASLFGAIPASIAVHALSHVPNATDSRYASTLRSLLRLAASALSLRKGRERGHTSARKCTSVPVRASSLSP